MAQPIVIWPNTAFSKQEKDLTRYGLVLSALSWWPPGSFSTKHPWAAAALRAPQPLLTPQRQVLTEHNSGELHYLRARCRQCPGTEAGRDRCCRNHLCEAAGRRARPCPALAGSPSGLSPLPGPPCSGRGRRLPPRGARAGQGAALRLPCPAGTAPGQVPPGAAPQPHAVARPVPRRRGWRGRRRHRRGGAPLPIPLPLPIPIPLRSAAPWPRSAPLRLPRPRRGSQHEREEGGEHLGAAGGGQLHRR